jgi:hypothetical protein
MAEILSRAGTSNGVGDISRGTGEKGKKGNRGTGKKKPFPSFPIPLFTYD